MRYIFLFVAFLQTLSAEMTPEKAFQQLIEGNQRFIKDKSSHPNRAAERRQETSEKQEPFATIVGCSDSRVPLEIVFDQGIGDLFIVRVAGNVVGPVELDSVEYSAIYLHSSIILVLGHENCGAVAAVIDGKTQDIEAVATLLDPAVIATGQEKTDRLEKTIKLNAQMVAEKLRKSPPLKKLIDQKKLDVKVGYYNFHTGKVEIL